MVFHNQIKSNGNRVRNVRVFCLVVFFSLLSFSRALFFPPSMRYAFVFSLSLALSVLSPEKLLVFTSSHIASFLLLHSLSEYLSSHFDRFGLFSRLFSCHKSSSSFSPCFALVRSPASNSDSPALERTLRRTGRFQTFHSLGIFVRPALPFRKLPPRLEIFFDAIAIFSRSWAPSAASHPFCAATFCFGSDKERETAVFILLVHFVCRLKDEAGDEKEKERIGRAFSYQCFSSSEDLRAGSSASTMCSACRSRVQHHHSCNCICVYMA